MELFRNILQVSVTTTIIILILSILHPLLFKKYSAKWCYFIWLAIAVRLLIPFNLAIPQTIFQITLPPIASQPITTILGAHTNTYDSSNTESITNQNLAKTSYSYYVPTKVSSSSDMSKTTQNDLKIKEFSPMQIASIVWIVGFIIFSFYHLIGYLLYKKSILRWSIAIKKAYTLDTLEIIKRELKIKDSIRVMVSKQVEVPMMVGFVKPVIWLPNEEYSQKELEFVLRHELIHYKHYDTVYKAIIFLARAFHWFNPAVHLMTFYTNIAIESYCDDVVVKNKDICFRENYGEIILASIKARRNHGAVFSTYFCGNFKTMKTRIANIFDIRFRRNGVLAAAVMLVLIAASSTLVACSSEKFTSHIVNPENTAKLLPSPIPTKDAVNLTKHSVMLRNISTNVNQGINIVNEMESQKLELNFKKIDITNASFTYPSALCATTKKELSQIKEVIKEEVIDNYKVIAYEDNDGGFYLGYIKDNVLYCLDSFDSEMKHFFNSITFSQFENVLGAEKGFVVGFSMGTFIKYNYYEINNGVPQVLTFCNNTIQEIDLNNDGMKEIINTVGTPLTTFIQVKEGTDVYQSNLNEDIQNKIKLLFGLSLGSTSVQYDENKNAFIFSTGRKLMEGSIEGYAFW